MTAYKTQTGVSYPSVTTILGTLGKGDALVQWAANCAVQYIEEKIKDESMEISDVLKSARFDWRNVSREALDIGSAVHSLIEAHIKGEKIQGPFARPEIENAFCAFREWENEHVDRWMASEQTIICEEYGFAGTLDAICEMKDGRIFYIDFKSSKGFYDEYKMQIAAYKYGHGEHPGAGVGILRLDKETGLPEFKDFSESYDTELRSFLKLLDFYYANKKRRLKNNPFVEKYWGVK